MNYQETIDNYVKQVNEALLFFTSKDKGKVGEAIRYSLNNSGKRIRPVLCMLTCDVLANDWQPALIPSIALEMVHTYSLIHDDLPCMDDDDFRRGQPSCHKRFGETIALLAGDALQAKAYEILSMLPDASISRKCVQILANASGISGMVYGQELDLIDTKDESILHTINENKTGKMITASVLMGYSCSQNTESSVQKSLTDYSEKIGEVFQVVDDILDVVSTQEVLGKPIGSDERNDKLTYVSLFGLDNAKQYAAKLTDEACESLSVLKDKAEPLKWYAKELLVRIK